jgi:hypothetical protein
MPFTAIEVVNEMENKELCIYFNVVSTVVYKSNVTLLHQVSLISFQKDSFKTPLYGDEYMY